MSTKAPRVTVEILKHWIPVFFTIISTIISLYFYRFKSQLKDELRNEFVSRSTFEDLRKTSDKTAKIVGEIPVQFVSRETLDPFVDKVQRQEVQEGKIETALESMQLMMREMRDDIKEIRRQGAR